MVIICCNLFLLISSLTNNTTTKKKSSFKSLIMSTDNLNTVTIFSLCAPTLVLELPEDCKRYYDLIRFVYGQPQYGNNYIQYDFLVKSNSSDNYITIWNEYCSGEFTAPVKLYAVCRLSGNPVACLTYIHLCDEIKKRVLEKTIDDEFAYASFLILNESNDAVQNLFRKSHNEKPINAIDPITLDDLIETSNNVSWIEDNKVYRMCYDSMIQYAKNFIDKNLPILNPYTRNPIESPWKEEIEFMMKTCV